MKSMRNWPLDKNFVPTFPPGLRVRLLVLMDKVNFRLERISPLAEILSVTVLADENSLNEQC